MQNLNVMLTTSESGVARHLVDLIYYRMGASDGEYGVIMLIGAILSIILPYLIGSVNPAVIISKRVYHSDIRTHGSGNAGTTNMLRTFGKKAAVATFLLDMFKAAFAVILGRLILGVDGGALAGFFVAFGHMFPIFHQMRGGKGVACVAMVMLVISPWTFIFSLLCFLVIVIGTRYVSLASVMCALLYPLFLRAFANEGLNVAMAVATTVFVVCMHHQNLKRIWNGTESKLDLEQFKIRRKKRKASDEDEKHDD